LQNDTLNNIYDRVIRRQAPRSGCPVEGCGAPLKRGHLMCLGHWRRVPKPLAVEINETWKKINGGDCGIESAAEVVARYRAAKTAAIEHVSAAS